MPVDWTFSLENTVYGTILLRTQERIQSLALPSIDDDSVQVRKLAWAADENDIQPPYIFVTPRQEITAWTDGSNERDQTVYGVMISVVLANGRDVTTKGMGLQLYWRQLLRRAFQNKSMNSWSELTLPSDCSFVRSSVESGDQFIEAAKRMQYDAQYWLLRVVVWEPRT